jgi:hypothetical protein
MPIQSTLRQLGEDLSHHITHKNPPNKIAIPVKKITISQTTFFAIDFCVKVKAMWKKIWRKFHVAK